MATKNNLRTPKENCNWIENNILVPWWTFSYQEMLKSGFDIFEIEHIRVVDKRIFKMINSKKYNSIICIREPKTRFLSAAKHLCEAEYDNNYTLKFLRDLMSRKLPIENNGLFYEQCSKLSREKNANNALEKLKKFDIIFNVSLLSNKSYSKKIENEFKNILGWTKPKIIHDNDAQKRNKIRNANKVDNSLTSNDWKLIEKFIKDDLEFYKLALNYMLERYEITL